MKKNIRNFVLSIITVSSILCPSFAEVTIPANVDPGALNTNIKTKQHNNYIEPEKELIDSSKVIPQDLNAINYSETFMLNGIIYSI